MRFIGEEEDEKEENQEVEDEYGKYGNDVEGKAW